MHLQCRLSEIVVDYPDRKEVSRVYVFVTPSIIMPFFYEWLIKTVVGLEIELSKSCSARAQGRPEARLRPQARQCVSLPRHKALCRHLGAAREETGTAITLNISRILLTSAKCTVVDLV